VKRLEAELKIASHSCEVLTLERNGCKVETEALMLAQSQLQSKMQDLVLELERCTGLEQQLQDLSLREVNVALRMKND